MNPATLSSNEKALKQSISPDDMAEAGGIMPREVAEDFMEMAVDETPFLDAIRTEMISSPKTRIPKYGVGERQRRGQAPGAEGARASVEAGFVDIDTEKGSVWWDLRKETVENYTNGEELAEFILSQMTQQFGVDTQELAISGDMNADTGDSDLDDFLRQNDGFVTLAQQEGMPTYSHTDDTGTALPVNNDLFSRVRESLDEKYLSRSDPVYITSSSQVHAYAKTLAENYDAAGFQILMGDDDLTPFGFDIMGIPRWPDDKMLFTDTDNLIYAIFRDLEVDILTESDDIAERDLFAKYFLRARDDFAFENTDAGVLATDIAAPNQA